MKSADASYMAGKRKESPSIEEYVTDAYRIADAMLAQRDK